MAYLTDLFVFPSSNNENRYTEIAVDKLVSLRNKPGVYVFHTAKKCLYVGTAKNLSKRIGQSARRLFDKFDKIVYLTVYFCETSADAAILEIFIINIKKPKMNNIKKLHDGVTLELVSHPSEEFTIKFLKSD